jgi:UDP-N-acetylmuramoyl-L-alanyl-D-glutamate--2,6-diaminopimelate ligase
VLGARCGTLFDLCPRNVLHRDFVTDPTQPPPTCSRARLASALAGSLRRVTLRELMGGDAPDVEITGLHYSSSDVRPGGLFFCVPGFKVDGHEFAPDAVERGAAAIVSERPLGLDVPELVVPSARAAMGPAAARFYGDPTATLEVVGITGTNGKTTTAFLARAILERAGTQTGLLGTVKSIVGGVEEPVERTTPEGIDLQATFRRMLDAGDKACAMEVSSHALELGRAAGIHFACRVFTNLSQDHLDFHPDMEAYFGAKRRLFEVPGPAVLNMDDDYGKRLAEEVPEPITYGVESEADYRAREISFDPSGSSFTCDTPDGQVAIATRLPGLFNVQNALAALAASRSLGVDLEVARAALAEAGRVPGRFEPVDEGQPFTVLVDYAHTPEALDNVLRAARELTDGRVHVVFGAGGDRDRAKRPLMGKAAAELADRVVVTSDNPRSENPRAIIEEILAGTGPGVECEPDRRRAIELVVSSADPGDVVVVAGKGHEQGQEFENGRKEPFDDVTVVREALR